MRKALLSIAAILAIAGCAKENVNPIENESGKSIRSIYASVASDETKTTLGIDNTKGVHAWSPADEIAVAVDGVVKEFVLESGKKFNSKTTIANDATLTAAVYPATFATIPDGNISITIPSTIDNYVPGTTNAIMVAGAPDANDYFEFHQVAGLLKFTVENVPVGTSQFILSSENNTFSGTWNNVNNTSSLLVGNIDGVGGKSITLNLKKTIEVPNQKMSFYVPVPVATYSDFSINLKGTDVDVKRSVSGLSLNVGRGAVVVTPTITLDAVVAGHEVLYYETFGSITSNTDISSTLECYTDALTSSIISTSGWKVSKNTSEASSYEGASGNSNAYSGSNNSYVTFIFGNTFSLKSNVKLSFGYKKGSANNKANTITCVISNDGGITWSADIIPSNTGAGGWYTVEYDIADSYLANLAIKFSNTAANTNRLDDVKLSCSVDSPTPPAVSSIAISKVPSTTTYYVGDSFNPAGGVITAFYVDGTSSEVDITEAMCSGFDSSAADPEGQVINVTYEGQSSSFKVVINPRPSCAITWSVSGATTITNQEYGNVIDFPENPEPPTGRVFMGWTASASVNSDGSDIVFITDSDVVPSAAAVTYYAVFASEVEGTNELTYGWEESEPNSDKFENTFLNTDTSISAHTGEKYGANVNANGNAVAGNSCSISTKEKIAAKTVKFYYSKTSKNTTTQNWVLQTSADKNTWTSNVTTASASGATKGEWSTAEWTLDGSPVYIKITMSASGTAVRTIDDLSISYTGTTYGNYSL